MAYVTESAIWTFVSKMFVRGGRPKQQPHDEVGDVKQHSDDQPHQEDSHHEIDESLHGSG